MVWFPPQYNDTPDDQKEIHGDTDHRYVLIDKERKLAWKVYVLVSSGKDNAHNKRHYDREKGHNKKISKNPHSNLLTIRDDGFMKRQRDGKREYGVMKFDYLPRTLRHVIWDRSLKYGADDVLSAAFQMFEGLAHLHNVLDITHRDIKPDNIFIDANGILKIADFNISRLGAEGRLESGTGTLRYMHPAQFDSETYRAEEDLWSAGVILWELVTRKFCFDNYTKQQTQALYKKGEYKVRSLDGDHVIIDIIVRCCKAIHTSKSTLEWGQERLEEGGLRLKDRFETISNEDETSHLPVGLEFVTIIEPKSTNMLKYLFNTQCEDVGEGKIESSFPMPDPNDLGIILGNDEIARLEDPYAIPDAVEAAPRRGRIWNWFIQTFSCHPRAARGDTR